MLSPLFDWNQPETIRTPSESVYASCVTSQTRALKPNSTVYTASHAFVQDSPHENLVRAHPARPAPVS